MKEFKITAHINGTTKNEIVTATSRDEALEITDEFIRKQEETNNE